MATRAQISSRLKAARQLHGDVDSRGKPKPLSVSDLVEREPLKRNGVTKNRVQEIEQLTVEARPWEVECLAEALDLPTAWFEAEDWRPMIYAEGSPTVRQIEDDRDLALLALAELRDELGSPRKSGQPAGEPATRES